MTDTSDFERLLREMEAYAAEHHVPIINENGRQVSLSVFREVLPRRVLEIGTAIGYSALLLAANGAADAHVTTLELSEGALRSPMGSSRARPTRTASRSCRATRASS